MHKIANCSFTLISSIGRVLNPPLRAKSFNFISFILDGYPAVGLNEIILKIMGLTGIENIRLSLEPIIVQL